MRKVAWVAVLLLAGCSAEAPVEPLQTEAVPTHSQEQYEGLEGVVAKIEEATNTEVGVALYDGTTLTQAGSLDTLPA